MTIVVLLVVVAAVGAAAVMLAGRTGGQAEFAPDRPRFELPARAIEGADVDAVRFSVGARGYRMDQVDQVMDRLAAELRERDRVLAELRPGGPRPAAPGETATPTDADDASAPDRA